MLNTERSSSDSPGTFFSINPDESLSEEETGTSAGDENYRRRLGRILSSGVEKDADETIPTLLELGAERLGVENAHLVRVDPAKGTHTIEATSGPHPAIERGATADLSGTYCRKLVAGREVLAVENAPEQGWTGDPAYEGYGLATYLGAKIVVEEKLYGTLCFVDSEPREAPFGEEDIDFLELLVAGITRELRRRRRDEQFRRTRTRLQVLFNESPDMVNVHDLEGNLLDPNPRLLQKTGYDEEELTDMKVWDLDPSLEPGAARRLWEGMEPGERKTLTGRYRRKDGTTFPVEMHLRRLDLEEKDRFVAISHDVTEREKREKSVRRLREKYEGLLEGAPDAVVVADATGTVREVNEATASLIGVPAEEIEGQPVRSFYPPVENGNYEALFRRHLDPGGDTETLSRFEDGSQVYLTRETGERVPVEASVTGVELGGESFVVGIFRDIRQRRERERRYEAIFNQTYQLTGLIEPDGTLIEVNDAALEMAGIGREEVLGTPLWDTNWFQADETDREKLRAAVERAAGGEFVRYEETIQTEEEPRIVDFSIRPLTDEDGEVQLLIPEGRDITERKTRERRLDRLNDLFQKAEELADIGAWEYDVETETSMGTDELYEIYGVPSDADLTTDQGMEFYHPDDRPQLREAFSRAVEEGVPYDLELRLATDSGEERWVRAHGEPKVSDGSVTRVRGTVQDITERKRREEALRASKEEAEEMEELFRSVFDNAPVMISIIGQNGQVERINDEFEAVLDWSQEEVRDQDEAWLWESLFPDPSQRQEALDTVRKAPDRWLDFRPRAKDGTPIDSTWTNVELSDGRRLSLGLDITDRKRRERKVEETNATLEAILNNLPVGVLTEDASRQVLAANERLCEIFELPLGPAALEGRDCADAAQNLAGRFANSEAFGRRIEEILSQGDPVVGEELQMADGRVLERDFVPYEIPQGTAGLWVYQDITERKRREEELIEAKQKAEKASRLKSAMLANMNHEIRTPLTSVTGFADIMRGELEGRMKEFAARIHKSGERLMRTLDSVLQLSKLEAGISDIEREEVDLAHITRETAELLRPTAKEKGISLETELPDAAVPGMWNEGALNRIVENLIENAIKFTSEEGRVTVRLRDEQEQTVLEVEDTGVGIGEAAQGEIFEAFQQESEGLGREFEGSGLGLSIVQRLVDVHDGEVEVESEEGEGSCFAVYLPRA